MKYSHIRELLHHYLLLIFGMQEYLYCLFIRHDMAEILLKLALNTNQLINCSLH